MTSFEVYTKGVLKKARLVFFAHQSVIRIGTRFLLSAGRTSWNEYTVLQFDCLCNSVIKCKGGSHKTGYGECMDESR